MMDGAMPPTTVDPTAQPAFDPAFEAKRRQVAMALMAQRGMQKPTAMGNFANSGLQMWNMMRKAPRPAQAGPPTHTPIAPPMPNGPLYGEGG
jgi:hypothetical protein